MRKICLSHCQKAAAILRSSEPTYTSQPTLDEDAKLLLYTRAVFIIPGHGVGSAASHTHPCAASARAKRYFFWCFLARARREMLFYSVFAGEGLGEQFTKCFAGENVENWPYL